MEHPHNIKSPSLLNSEKNSNGCASAIHHTKTPDFHFNIWEK